MLVQGQVMKSTRRRLNTCFVWASLNFMSLLSPPLVGWSSYVFIIIGLALNAVVVCMVLKEVDPLADVVKHELNVALTRRWVTVIGVAGTLAVLVAGVQGGIGRQSIPFILCGYALLMIVPGKVMSLAVSRKMDEIDGK